MMRTFTFHCPGCNQKFEAPEDFDGSELDCPTCGQHFEADDWIKLSGLENASVKQLKEHRKAILEALAEMEGKDIFKLRHGDSAT